MSKKGVKRVNGIKWLLFGIALILLSLVCLIRSITGGGSASTLLSLGCSILGMAVCIIGVSRKD